ncbi:MAG TPA: hypothetical protein VM118_10050 [Acidobacteriota bacterium]|nr:hypothetical protein [Acidobacteriota bacterium]
MSSILRWLCYAAIPVLILVLATPCRCDTVSRIVLRDSTVYHDAEVAFDDIYKTVEIKAGDWKRTVSITDIAAIFDTTGQDVTGKYLGEYYRAPGDTVSADADAAGFVLPDVRIHRFPWNFGLHSSGNFSIPLGDFYEGIKAGVGYGFEMTVPVARNIAVRAFVSRSGMRDDLDVPASEYIVHEDDFGMSVWRYVLAAQYHEWPRWKTGGRVMYYLYSGLGAISHKTTGHMLIEERATGNLLMIEGSGESLTKLIVSEGFGIVAKVSRNLGVEAKLALDLVFVGAREDPDYFTPYGNVEQALIIDFQIGLVLLL